MSYNLRCDTPDDGDNAWPHRADEAAQVVVELAPDVFGVQEGFFGMLEDLNERLPGYTWLGQGRDGGGEGEFSAIFYRPDRLRVVSSGHFWLSSQPDTPGSIYPGASCPRMCTWAHFIGGRKEHAKEFYFFNTHLDHRSEEARVAGALMILERLDEARKKRILPAILTGDMNAWPESPAILALLSDSDSGPPLYDAADWLRDRGGQIGATYHGFQGDEWERGTLGEPIDYVFHTEEWGVNAFGVYKEQINGRYPSDHYPVWADLVLT